MAGEGNKYSFFQLEINKQDFGRGGPMLANVAQHLQASRRPPHKPFPTSSHHKKAPRKPHRIHQYPS
jgi:hypothetical protein